MTAKHTPAKEHRRLDRERKAAQKRRRKLLEAAAPEMLAELKKWISLFAADCSEIGTRVKATIAIIRKARGE